MRSPLYRLALAFIATTLGAAAPTDAANPPADHTPWSVAAEVGLGYDSNVYRAPRAPYTDYAAVGDPPVVPDARSGFFIPTLLDIGYRAPLARRLRVEPSYRFDGRWYGDDLANANEYDHRLRLRTAFVPSEPARRATLAMTPYLGVHRQVYVDHDSGLDKTTTAGTDIANRYSYRTVGIEAEWTDEFSILQYTIKAEAAQRDYDDPGVVSQLDHVYYRLGGDAEMRLAKPVRLDLSYDYSIRDYDERPSRDLQGALTASAVTYTYHAFGASLRNRLHRGLRVMLDYELTLRSDAYAGYNDYTEHQYTVRGIAGGRGRGRLAAAVGYTDRDYPNAFAFEDPLQPRKTFQSFHWSLTGEWAVDPRWALWTDIRSGDQDTNDLRYDYIRYVAMAGMRWTSAR
ncbi:MAG: hypothetical protein ABIO65_05615 [Nitrospiria bacterium]